MDDILALFENEDEQPVESAQKITTNLFETINYVTADMKIGIHEAEFDGDEYYNSLRIWLASEKERKGLLISPHVCFRILHDHGYVTNIIEKSATNNIFLLKMLINRFGVVDREFYSRVVTVVFFYVDQTPEFNTRAKISNYFFGDGEVTYEQQISHDTI